MYFVQAFNEELDDEKLCSYISKGAAQERVEQLINEYSFDKKDITVIKGERMTFKTIAAKVKVEINE